MDRNYLARRSLRRALLRKNPGFTAVAILTLALGIGANTAVFSVVNAVVLRPLPYKNSERIVSVKTSAAMLANLELGNSWVAFEQIRKNASALDQLTAYRSYTMTLTASGDPARLSVMKVADSFFDFFGAGPQIGRLFVAGDQTESQGRAAVLSDAFWRDAFRRRSRRNRADHHPQQGSICSRRRCRTWIRLSTARLHLASSRSE